MKGVRAKKPLRKNRDLITLANRYRVPIIGIK